ISWYLTSRAAASSAASASCSRRPRRSRSPLVSSRPARERACRAAAARNGALTTAITATRSSTIRARTTMLTSRRARSPPGEAARGAGPGAGRDASANCAGRGPDRDQAAAEDDQAADPYPHHERRDDQVELRRWRALQVRAREVADRHQRLIARQG